MKKLAIFGLLSGLGGLVLTSCDGGNVRIEVSDPVRNLKLAKYTSDKTLEANITDQFGQTWTKGTPVICSNIRTQVEADVTWTGGLKKLTMTLVGVKNGGTLTTSTDESFFAKVNYSGKGKYIYRIAAGKAPLSLDGAPISAQNSLNTQSIVVTPIAPKRADILGGTYIEITSYDAVSQKRETIRSAALPVVKCG